MACYPKQRRSIDTGKGPVRILSHINWAEK